MEKVTRVAIDLASGVSHLTAVDDAGSVVERKRFRRAGRMGDPLQRRRQGLALLPRRVRQGVPDQMHDAGLHRRPCTSCSPRAFLLLDPQAD